jgi:hypothetical protein
VQHATVAARACRVSSAALVIGAALCGCVALAPRAPFPVQPPPAISAEGRAVAVIGDLQMTSWLVRTIKRREFNRDEQALLLADLNERLGELAAVVLLGDLVYNARSRRDWAHFDALLRPAATRVPLLPAMGNHDYNCWFIHLCSQRIVPKNVRLRFPWLRPGQPYWVPFGNLVLVFLDSETALDAQGDWLSARLAEFEAQFSGIVVFAHRPPYTDSTASGLSPDPGVRAHIVPALKRTRMTPLLVSGHAHGYEHLLVDDINYVVSGGGGGPRSPLSADRPADQYTGRDCRDDISGQVLRPFNFLLLSNDSDALRVTVRGLCAADTKSATLDAFSIPLRSSP